MKLLAQGVGRLRNGMHFFLLDKTDHLLSASPLILIKKFLELRRFSNRIEGHILMLFLRGSWNGKVPFIVSMLLQSWKKARTKQKIPTLLTLPRAANRVFNEHCISSPSSKATWKLSTRNEPWRASPAHSGAATQPGNWEKEPHKFPLHLQVWISGKLCPKCSSSLCFLSSFVFLLAGVKKKK